MRKIWDNVKKALKERIPNHILHVQFQRKISVSQSNLLYPLYMYNNPKQQKMPKRINMFTSKWHRKQRDFFIHPFTSLQCIWFVGRNFFVKNKLTRALLSGEKGGMNFQLFPLLGSLAIWLDQTGTCTTLLLGLQYKTRIGSLWYLAMYRGDAITRFTKTCIGKTDRTPYWAPESRSPPKSQALIYARWSPYWDYN